MNFNTELVIFPWSTTLNSLIFFFYFIWQTFDAFWDVIVVSEVRSDLQERVYHAFFSK